MCFERKPPTASLRAKEGLMGKGPGLAIYAAPFAVVGFIGGALVGPHPGPHGRAPRSPSCWSSWADPAGCR